MENLVIFAVVNLIAATLSGASGGGGGLISAPFLVLLGLSPATAIATGKFGGLGVSAGTSLRFFGEDLTNRKTVLWFSLLGAICAVIGTTLLTQLSDQEELLENLMGCVILVAGIPLLYLKNIGLETKNPPRYLKVIGTFLLAIGLIFQATLGAGVGSLQLVVLMGCFGMTALTASANRRAMQLTVAALSLTILISVGLVDFQFGAISFVTSFVGGWMGAHIAIKKGNKFVINLFAITSAILALQLLFG